MNEKNIKQEIRKLKKLKLQLRPGTDERLTLEHKIKDLKKQLIEINIVEPEKQNLINEILKFTPNLHINLNKFTIKQLQKHINILKCKNKLDKE